MSSLVNLTMMQRIIFIVIKMWIHGKKLREKAVNADSTVLYK